MAPNLPNPLAANSAASIIECLNGGSDSPDIMAGDFVYANPNIGGATLSVSPGFQFNTFSPPIGISLSFCPTPTDADPTPLPSKVLIATAGIYPVKIATGSGEIDDGQLVEANVDGSQTVFLAGKQGFSVQPWTLGIALQKGTDGDTILIMLFFTSTSTGNISPSEHSIFGEIPTGTIDGSNTVFTLSKTPTSSGIGLYSIVSGVTKRLHNGVDYGTSGATITMTSAPSVGTVLLVDYTVVQGE